MQVVEVHRYQDTTTANTMRSLSRDTTRLARSLRIRRKAFRSARSRGLMHVDVADDWV